MHSLNSTSLNNLAGFNEPIRVVTYDFTRPSGQQAIFGPFKNAAKEVESKVRKQDLYQNDLLKNFIINFFDFFKLQDFLNYFDSELFNFTEIVNALEKETKSVASNVTLTTNKKLSPFTSSQKTKLPPPLEEGRLYIKPKEESPEKPIKKVKETPIQPIQGLVPGFSTRQQRNLACAKNSFMALESRVKFFFGKENPQIVSLEPSVRKKFRRECEYYILRAFEAMNPTGRETFKGDEEYYTKLTLCLGSCHDLHMIRNSLRSDFYKLRTKWIFQLAIEIAKREPSRMLQAMKNLQSPKSNILKNALKASAKEPRFKKMAELKLNEEPSFENDRFFLKLIRKELEIIYSCKKVDEDFYTFSQVNLNIPTMKKCLSNIQKLSARLIQEASNILNHSPKFLKIKEMGVRIAHEIPEELPLGEGDDVSPSELYKLIYEDPEFFSSLFKLIESFNYTQTTSKIGILSTPKTRD